MRAGWAPGGSRRGRQRMLSMGKKALMCPGWKEPTGFTDGETEAQEEERTPVKRAREPLVRRGLCPEISGDPQPPQDPSLPSPPATARSSLPEVITGSAVQARVESLAGLGSPPHSATQKRGVHQAPVMCKPPTHTRHPGAKENPRWRRGLAPGCPHVMYPLGLGLHHMCTPSSL